MKKIITLIFILHSLSTFAQNGFFDFYTSSGTNHPFGKSSYFKGQNMISDQKLDSTGIITTVEYEAKNRKFILHKENTVKELPVSPEEKPGYNYSYRVVSVDENNTTYISAHGYLNNTSNFEYYIIKIDRYNNLNYIYEKDILNYVSAKHHWVNAIAVNNKLLIEVEGNFFWFGNPTISINKIAAGISNSKADFFSDKKNTIYYISNEAQSKMGIMSFYGDGTYERRLVDKTIKGYQLNEAEGKLTVFAIEGVYELKGKTQNEINIPSYDKLSATGPLQPFYIKREAYLLKGVLSNNGFSVNDNGVYITHLFGGKTQIHPGTLYYNPYYSQYNTSLQEDSTLVFHFYHDENLVSKTSLFTYKKGTAKWNNTYDWVKLKLKHEKYLNKVFYVSSKHSYYYGIQGNNASGINNYFQIKDDSTATIIPFGGYACADSIKGQMMVDKDSFWMRIQHRDDNSNCAIARMRHDSYFVKGNVFYDGNTNGLLDPGEIPYSNVKLRAMPSGYMLTPDFEGNFTFKGDLGATYKIDVIDSLKFASLKKNGYSIGLKLKEENPDVRASFVIFRSRCNQNIPSRVTLENTGVVPVEKIIIYLVAHKAKLFQNNLPADTVTFEYSGLKVKETVNLLYNVQWPDAEETGKIATLTVITNLYSGNTLVSTKTDSIQSVIRCSYDPNDKAVTPAGVGNEHYTLKNSMLKYLIRFENTGNDTAYNIDVHDTLNANFDYNSFEVLGASHKVYTELNPATGLVVFHFKSIYLPDSTTDKKGAQGYVRFMIKPKVNVAEQTQVCNTAYIYFDENKPVITNTVCNLLVNTLPNLVTDIVEIENRLESPLYPNPANEWISIPENAESSTVYNAWGIEVLKSNAQVVSVSSLPVGIYLVNIHLKNGKTINKKLSVLR